MTVRIGALSRGTLAQSPPVCRGCAWWQSTDARSTSKERWVERAADEVGSWGSLYYDDDGRVLGSIQYGPVELFPRANELPAGPPTADAMVVTCAYLVDRAMPWVLQSLLLAAIGEARDSGAAALETFAYSYPEGETQYERFVVHKTIFPRDFLADLGFRTVRTAGRVELVRLDLGGLVPVVEGRREKVLRAVRAAFSPPPVPEQPYTG